MVVPTIININNVKKFFKLFCRNNSSVNHIMSNNNTELKDIADSNEWINWIEQAIAQNCFKYYEYNFINIQEIGSGGFGKVYRANWKNSHKYIALKSFFNFDNVTAKEVVRELKLQRDIDFHNNVIRFFGITYPDQENQNDKLKNYLLVIEYADGGTLQNYLREYFVKLTWSDKYKLAFQLAHAVLCLHEAGIVHRDLHPGNVLIHQNTVKLADYGLSKRIEEATKSQSKLYSILPYVDPKTFNLQGNKSSSTQIYSLNERSDVYSVGMILWEISSGKPPFYTEGKPYDFNLAVKISHGLKETIAPNTPTDYINLYTECWDNEPSNRPTMNQVVIRLKSMISVTNQSIYTYQTAKERHSSLNNETSDNSLHGEISQLIDINTIDKNNLLEEKFGIIVEEVVDIIFKLTNKGKEWKQRKQAVLDYFTDHNIDLQEIYNWLSNNQFNSDSIFLFGYFNYSYGIGIIENNEKAFILFINASERNHILAEYYVGLCYQFGDGTVKNEKLAFDYYKQIADKGFVAGELRIGYCYDEGIGTEKDARLANYWYKKAVNNENLMAMHNLALMYKNGDGIEKDHYKAFELFKKSAKGEYASGIMMLGYCYNNGIGTVINRQKAFKLYQKAAYLGDNIAQHNLALMYEYGDVISQDIDQAIYWYKESAKQGNQGAQYYLGKLRLQYRCPPKLFVYKV